MRGGPARWKGKEEVRRQGKEDGLGKYKCYGCFTFGPLTLSDFRNAFLSLLHVGPLAMVWTGVLNANERLQVIGPGP